jgi:outer membrane protein OmpA-like peptidoglycan-associated protein
MLSQFREHEEKSNSCGACTFMRFTKNLLNSLTVLCLFGRGSAFGAQQTQFHHAIVGVAAEARGAPNAVFVDAHFSEQSSTGDANRASTPKKGAGSTAQTLQEATPPKGRLLFAPNSVQLTVSDKRSLESAAAWLGQHPGDRVLIVGYCDDSGSETCTAALAERRSEAVRQCLLGFSARADQIAGTKGWENQSGPCRAGATDCQRQNRSVRLYLAEPTGSSK